MPGTGTPASARDSRAELPVDRARSAVRRRWSIRAGLSPAGRAPGWEDAIGGGSVTVRVLGPGDEAAIEAFLLPRIETSMFLLSNLDAAGIVDRGQTYGG